MKKTGDAVRRTAAAVRAEIARRGWSQTRLAEALGVSQGWVSRRTSGRDPFDVAELERIAAVLEVPLSRLLPAEDDDSPVRPRAAS